MKEQIGPKFMVNKSQNHFSQRTSRKPKTLSKLQIVMENTDTNN